LYSGTLQAAATSAITTTQTLINLLSVSDFVAQIASDPFVDSFVIVFKGFSGSASFSNTAGTNTSNNISFLFGNAGNLIGSAVNVGGSGSGSATFTQDGAGYMTGTIFGSNMTLTIRASNTTASVTYNLSMPFELYCR
jgi:hypothetical protein